MLGSRMAGRIAQQGRRIQAMLLAFMLSFSQVSALADNGSTPNENTLICGLEEHVHSEDCYDNVLICGQEESEPVTEKQFVNTFKVHKHEKSCYDSEGNVICGYAEDEYYHTHNEFCYDEEGNLVCGLKVKKPHIHTPECYVEEKVLICGQEESEGHTHGDSCYAEEKNLTCGQAEDPGHIHSASCYASHQELICGQVEDPGHTHGADCYKDRKELTCGQVEDPGHTHTDACYKDRTELTCGLAEEEGHTHTEACYQDRTELTCGQEEGPDHTHTEDCYTTYHDLICGKEEKAGHTHTEACYTTYRDLVCTEQERPGHTHTEACYTTYHDLVCTEQERPGHTHTDACYKTVTDLVCTEQERPGHTHTDDCYTVTRKLTCTKEESAGHTHTDACYETKKKLVCEEYTEHQHNEKCYDAAGKLICGKVEVPVFTCTADNWKTVTVSEGHKHTESCYEKQLVCTIPEHTHTAECYAPADESSEEPQAESEAVSSNNTEEENGTGEQTTDKKSEDEVTDEPSEDLEEKQEEEVKDESSEEPADENKEEVTDEPSEEPADEKEEEVKDEPSEEPADEKEEEVKDEPSEEPVEDKEEEVTDESSEEPADEKDEEVKDEPSEEPADEQEEEVKDEPSEEPVEDKEEEVKDEPSEEPVEDKEEEVKDEPSEEPAEDKEEEVKDEPSEEPAEEQEEEVKDEPSEEPAEEKEEEVKDEPSEEPADEQEEEVEDELSEAPVVEQDEEVTEEPTEEVIEEPVQYFDGVLSHEGSDYSVTAKIGADALMPADIRMRVREIKYGTAEYRAYLEELGMTLSEDWNEVDEFARFFDITFVTGPEGDETEIEPQAYIDVEIIFKESISTADDTEIQAVHFEDSGNTEMLPTNTDSNEAAVADPNAVDTVSFASDSFSVYGVVKKKTITEKKIEIDGYTYSIKVVYGREANIPEEAELSIRELTSDEYKAYLTSAAEALGTDIHSISYSKLFDISIVKDGVEYQPNDTVTVTVELLEDTAQHVEDVKVVHFSEEEKETGSPEPLEASTDGTAVTFKTEGFSVFSLMDYSLKSREISPDLEVKTGTLYENDDIILTGDMPAGGFVEAELVQVVADNKDSLVAYDIKIYANQKMKDAGIEWQPGEKSIQVTFKSDALDLDCVDIYHMENVSAEAEKIGESVAVENKAVTFEADSFSVYALTKETYHRTYRFFTLNDEGQYEEYTIHTDSGTTTYTQNIKNGESLVIPQLPSIEESDTSTFAGWYEGTGDVSSLPVARDSITLANTEFDFDNIPEITVNGEEVHLFAKFSQFYYVIFHDQYNGSTNSFPVAVTRRGEISDGIATVQISDVKVSYDDSSDEDTAVQMAFYGWSRTKITEAGSSKDVNGDTISKIETDSIDIDGTTHLYPIFLPINWLSFYSGSTGSGATYIPAQYYYQDEGPKFLSVPLRSGYSFQGWYTGSVDGSNVTYATKISEADGTLISGVSDSTYGIRVTDGVLYLSSDTQLFASWAEADVNYTIVIWKQKSTDEVNLDNDFKQYDYSESYILSGVTGQSVNVPSNYKQLGGAGLYEGCSYSRCDSEKKVAGDGSTVLNVYYDRNVRTLTFRVSGWWTTRTVRTITALYGASIISYFPITDEYGTSYDGYIWEDNSGKIYEYVLSTIETMPDADVTFTGSNRGTGKTVYYYVEVDNSEESDGTTFNNKYYTLYKTVNHNYNFLTYDEEYHPIEGYIRDYSHASPEFDTTSNKAEIGSNKKNYLYYDRETYTISFKDSYTNNYIYVGGIAEDNQLGDQNIKFKETIAEHVPSDPVPVQISGDVVYERDGYSFTGWYTDAACSTKVFFEDSEEYENYTGSKVLYTTMPASNLQFFAGWETIWYLIKIDPNGGEISEDGSTWFWEPYNGDPIQEYTWVTRNYVESPAGTFYYVVHDRDYYGYTDEWTEGENSDRRVYYTEDLNEATSYTTYKKAEGAYRYASWYEVLYDSEGNEIGEQLYSFGDPVTHNTTIRLHWKKIGTYNVSYDPGKGTIDGNDYNDQLFVELDNEDYADNAEVVVSRTANAPDGYNFVGWTIRNDDSGTVYYPGQTFVFKSKYAVTVDGQETIYLDAVYTRVKTAKIVYNVNGGTINEEVLDYGRALDTSTANPRMSCNVEDGTATISRLINNSEVKLSNGSGFTRAGATLVGWSTNPDYDPNSDILFSLGGTYYVDTLDPVTLYAVWQFKVYFIKNNSNADWGVDSGDYWDTSVYTYDSTNDRYYTTVYLNDTVDEPGYTPNSSQERELFYYWSTTRYSGEGNITAYNFSTPVTNELYLYGYWQKTRDVKIHAVQFEKGSPSNQDGWLTNNTSTKIEVDNTSSFSFANETAARSYAKNAPDESGWNEYAFTCVSDSMENCTDENAISSVWFNSSKKSIYVTYTDGRQEALADTDEIYIVFVKMLYLPIDYKFMATDGTIAWTDLNTGLIYEQSPVGERNITNLLNRPLKYTKTQFPYYSYAIGKANANSDDDLYYITTSSSSNSSRPNFMIRNSYKGLLYTTDGETWLNAGYEPQVYVIYFEYLPIILTLSEITEGFASDLMYDFEYNVDVLVDKDDITYLQYYGSGWSNSDEQDKSEEKTYHYSFKLANGAKEAYTLFYVYSNPDKYQRSVEDWAVVYTKHYLKVVTTITITQANYTSEGFTTVNDGGTDDGTYTYTYTTSDRSEDHTVTFTNTRIPNVEVHLGMVGSDGKIALKDTDRKSTALNDYTFSFNPEDEKTFLTEIPAANMFESDEYAFAGVYYGTDDGTTVTLTDVAEKLTYGQIKAPNIYDLYLDGDSSASLGENKIYYVYYPMPKLVYVRESAGGTLTRIQGATEGSITYNGNALTLNNMSVEQEQLLPMDNNEIRISQTISSGNFNMPPKLDDGTKKLYLIYTKLGAGGSAAITNISGLDKVTESKMIYVKADGYQFKWSLDEVRWHGFSGGAPTIYAIYKGSGHNLEVTKTVTGPGINTKATFTVVISSDAITESSYNVTGTGYNTIAAVPGDGTNPGTITLTVKHGSDITISGLEEGTYTFTETENGEAELSAAIGDESLTVTDYSFYFTLTDDTKVDLTNEMEGVVAPTGVTDNWQHSMLLLSIGMIMAGVLAVPAMKAWRRRKGGAEE